MELNEGTVWRCVTMTECKMLLVMKKNDKKCHICLLKSIVD